MIGIDELISEKNKEKTIHIEKLRTFLTEHNIQPSYHRLKILEYLLLHRIHPTVDIIFKDISKGIPTLSKTTIYNTLNLFMDKNIVKPITIEENEVRYDIYTHPHAHFKCMQCGEIIDLAMEDTDLHIKSLKDFKIIEQHIYLKGLCASCQK